MAAHYTNVTKEDIERALIPQGFKPITLPGVTELVYGKRVDRDGLQLTLRIYTGINSSGNSRGVGEDAMRCTIFQRLKNGDTKMVGGSKRVHRVHGWAKNLQNRIDNISDFIGPKCHVCGNLMVERDGKFGKFWSCCTYPTCKGTMNSTRNPTQKQKTFAGGAKDYVPSREECLAEAEIQDIEGGHM